MTKERSRWITWGWGALVAVILVMLLLDVTVARTQTGRWLVGWRHNRHSGWWMSGPASPPYGTLLRLFFAEADFKAITGRYTANAKELVEAELIGSVDYWLEPYPKYWTRVEIRLSGNGYYAFTKGKGRYAGYEVWVDNEGYWRFVTPSGKTYQYDPDETTHRRWCLWDILTGRSNLAGHYY